MSCQDLVLGDDDGVHFLPSRRPRRSVAARLTMIVNCCQPGELAARARALDQAAPPLMPTVPVRAHLAAGQRSIRGPVCRRPLPRLPPHIRARPRTGLRLAVTTERFSAAGCRELRDAEAASGATLRQAARRTWRISSSYKPIKANDGHAAITRPVNVGSATATFAARLATLPITSNTTAGGRRDCRTAIRQAASSTPRRSSRLPTVA